MDRPENILQTVMQFMQDGDYYSAVTAYDLVLKKYPGFVERYFKNRQNLELHEIIASHSLLQQAYGSLSKNGYEIDISPYLGSGGKIYVESEFSEHINAFKITPAFAKDKELVLQHYSETLRTIYGKLDKVNWSPVYLAYWVLDDFFKIKTYFPRNCHKVVDIGCGLGSINILINQLSHVDKTFTLIDVEEKFLDISQRFLAANKMPASTETQDYYDLVISLRSCCYLYSYKEYESLFLEQTRKGSTIIIDISADYLAESISFFESFCEHKIPLQSGAVNYQRFAFIR